MNWKRIWMGTAMAGMVFLLFDFSIYIIQDIVKREAPWVMLWRTLPGFLGPYFVTGFLLSWMYVLARPRLGPGPKTALIVGTVGFALANIHLFSYLGWINS